VAEGPVTRIEIVPGGPGRLTVGPLALDLQTSLLEELRETLVGGLQKLAASSGANSATSESSAPGPCSPRDSDDSN
jgi:hypothetical protein